MATITDYAKKFLEFGVPEGVDNQENPFLNEKGVLYLRYDRIEIQDASDEYGGLIVRFFWRTRHVGSVRIEDGASLGQQVITLSGMEGKMLVTLTQA